MNISHQSLDYRITFVNSQHEKKILKVILYSNSFKRWFGRFFVYKNKSDSDLV